MPDQPTFEHVGSGFEANNFPHRRTEGDAEAAVNTEFASGWDKLRESGLSDQFHSIAVQAVKSEAVKIPVRLNDTLELPPVVQ